MIFSLRVGRLQAAVKKKKSPTNKDEFLGYLKTETGSKGEFKNEILWGGWPVILHLEAC